MPKAHGQIRKSQIVTTFGPGALMDLPHHSVIVGGLDSWKWHSNDIKDRKVVIEARLANKLRGELGVQRLDFFEPPIHSDDPSKPSTGVTAYRFPEWYVTQRATPWENNPSVKSRLLVHASRDGVVRGGKFVDEDGNKHPVVPIRFIRACPRGHIGDINWKDFVHRKDKANCSNRNLYIDEYGASGDISDIVVRCGCKASRPLIEATKVEDKPLGFCDGNRPWLGLRQNEHCKQISRLLIRSASNVYFPQTISVISIPESASALENAVEAVSRDVANVTSVEDLKTLRRLIRSVGDGLHSFSDEQVLDELNARRSGSARPSKPVKQSELETLLRAEARIEIDDADRYFNAKALPESEWKSDAPWMEPIQKVVLVHKLREVVAQIGFTRFEPKMSDINGEPDFDLRVETASLSANESPTWFPAYENRGEGIFISFKTEAIAQWMANEKTAARVAALKSGFDQWKALPEHANSQRVFPEGPYYFLHSLSHLLITSISLECGYPASSIKERIYSMPGTGYGILLYTGTADSEGTLGGIIEVGRNIREHVKAALDSGKLCSNDPVCVQHEPSREHGNGHLLGAACHGCLLISETSCEQQNEFLDRSLVVPTLENAGSAFFKGII